MAPKDMFILKNYIKSHSTSFFFTSKKNIKYVTARVDSVVNRPCISIMNVFSVTAYNTLMTKPIVKHFVGEINAIFYLAKSFV